MKRLYWKIEKIFNKIMCFLFSHKPKIADNDDWSDLTGRIPAKWTIEYCTRCCKKLKHITL